MKPTETYQPGEAVYHPTFGAGVVTASTPGETVADGRVAVDFKNAGHKWLVLKYAHLVKKGSEKLAIKAPNLDVAVANIAKVPIVEAVLPVEKRAAVQQVDTAETNVNLKKQPAIPEQKTVQSRRNVLKLFAGLLTGTPFVATALTANPKKATRKLPVLETRIAGFAYYQGAECLSHIKPGDNLNLQRQPGNPHDGKAIEVYWQGKKIGYVPKSHNAALSKLLDGGEVLGVSVNKILERPWEPVEFNVYLHV